MVIPSKNPMHEAGEALMNIGFGSNEARAYCALLIKSPANGYQVAQQSGIPRAKVYECLGRLVARGAAVHVESQDKEARLYAPTDPRELLNGIEDGLNSAVSQARKALDSWQRNPQVVEVLWRITSRQDLVIRGKKLTREAKNTLHIAIWPEEFDALLPEFLKAVDRNVKIALVLYSTHPGIDKFREKCSGAILHARTKRNAVPVMGRQFVLVSDRERCITGSIFENDNVEGVFTLNLGLVTNAVDLVNHEIYLERIMVEVGKPLEEIFGSDLEKLDPFNTPKELSDPDNLL